MNNLSIVKKGFESIDLLWQLSSTKIKQSDRNKAGSQAIRTLNNNQFS